MYRMYVDEVGTDGLTNLDKDKHRFLSLSGIVVELGHVAARLEPNLNWIKVNVLHHDPDAPAVLHRTDIMGRKGIFQCLSNDEICSKFDECIIRLIKSTQFTVITAVIDKHGLLKQLNWRNTHPYHLLMDILVEKYSQFLERHRSIGDIMPEKRGSPKDERLQEDFRLVRLGGTYFVPSSRIKTVIRSEKLKFRWKYENVAGLQLCDLIAHPSHMHVREQMRHAVELGPFAKKVQAILVASKYDRSSTGKIGGYGIKYLP